MRFNSPEHLWAFRTSGTYPRIHDTITAMVVAWMQGGRVLDLGCSYGLLADRIITQAGAAFVLGIDADSDAIHLGRESGIAATLTKMRIESETVPHLVDMVTENGITVMVARRILPELFGHDLQLGHHFAAEMAKAGIREVFIEGRVSSTASVNPLKSIEEEVKVLSDTFKEVRRSGAVSYLQAL